MRVWYIRIAMATECLGGFASVFLALVGDSENAKFSLLVALLLGVTWRVQKLLWRAPGGETGR